MSASQAHQTNKQDGLQRQLMLRLNVTDSALPFLPRNRLSILAGWTRTTIQPLVDSINERNLCLSAGRKKGATISQSPIYQLAVV
ncbi:MAG: hypothetical protein AAFN77_19905 [Planctomycetota bacterium]